MSVKRSDFMRMFVIPTHRVCFEAIESFKTEIVYFQKETNEDAIFVLLDNGNTDNYQANQKFLSNIEFPCPKYHISLKDMNSIARYISKKLGNDISQLLMPYEVDYGKIFNYIYIIGILFKVSGIHRRDSDCQLLTLNMQNMPICMETRFLGQSVFKARNDLSVDEQIDYSLDEKVYMVGSGYLGDWDLDMKAIVEKNPDALKYLMKICNIEESVIADEYNKKYGNSDEHITESLPILTSIFDTSHALECGNTSLTEIYDYIPNFIGKNGVGFDYHTNFVAFECKVPMVYHYNKIYHIHDKFRHHDIKPLNYWKGIIKMVDFDNYHYSMITHNDFTKMCNGKYGIDTIKRISNKILPDILQYRFEKLERNKRIQNIDEITHKILMESHISEYEQIGKCLDLEKEKILLELDEEYAHSIELQRKWSDIVEVIRDTDPTVYLRPVP